MADIPPTSAPRPTSDFLTETISTAKELGAIAALAGALWAIIFVAVPTANHDPVIIVISGLLGFLTGRGSRTPAPVAPPAVPEV